MEDEDNRQIREIVSREFQASPRSIKEISGGASHNAYSVLLENSEEYFIKFSDYDWSGLPEHEHGFPIDAPVLRYLSTSDKIPTPRLKAFDNSEENFDFKYMIAEKVRGDNMFEAWDKVDLSTVREAGRVLAWLHESFSFKDHGKLGWRDGGEKMYVEESKAWDSMVEDIRYTFSENLEDTGFAEYRSEMEELFEDNKDILREDPPSVLVHQEFGPRNMLVDQGEISGVVDWERAISADPEYDLFMAERQFTAKTNLFEGTEQESREIHEALRNGYREVRGLEPGWRKRRKLYHLIYVTQVMWVLDDIVDNKGLLKQFEDIKEDLRDK